MFSNVKLGSKIAAGFGGIILLTFATSLFSVIELKKIQTIQDEAAKRTQDVIEINEIRSMGYETYQVVADIVIDGWNDDTKKTWQEIVLDGKKDMEKLKGLLDTPEESAWAESASKNLAEIVSLTEGKMIPMIKISQEMTTEVRDVDEAIDKLGTDFKEKIGFIVKSVETEATNANLEARESVKVIFFITIISAIIAIVCAVLVTYIIVKQVTSSLIKISTELKESSIQVASASEELSNAAAGLSSSSSEQAGSVEETSASLEEISGMIQNNLTHAEQAFNLSNKVKDVSEIGNQNMEQLEASMKDILLSNEKIEQLVKVIGNIGEKTQVMDEIVFQTKLLSFNASVEAERAGEHGRGFAVVAQEVGNLAQMSGKAAKEIADIVKESIKNTEIITSENKKRVEQGNSYVIETGKNLKEIMRVAGTVSIGAKQVLDASKDQAKGIEQINSAMGQIDKSTQENAATAEEAASSSEVLSAQTEVLNSVVEELLKLVNGNNKMQANGRTFSHYRNKKNLPERNSIKKTAQSPAGQKKNGFKVLTKRDISVRNAGTIAKGNESRNFSTDKKSEVRSIGENGWDSI